jgi:predicted nucleic-acid-binding protein
MGGASIFGFPFKRENSRQLLIFIKHNKLLELFRALEKHLKREREMKTETVAAREATKEEEEAP